MNSGPTSLPRCASRIPAGQVPIPVANRLRRARLRASGFTLAETLVALLFLAIVLPVTIEGLQLASYAGQVSQRRAIATRIADRILQESIATGTWQGGTGSGVVEEDHLSFRWNLRSDAWPEGTLRVLTVAVEFAVQGRPQEVLLASLVDAAAP